MAGYRLSIRAQEDLENIWEYTVDEWSVNQAEKYARGLISCFIAIADGRIEGKLVDSIRIGYRKTLFSKHYIFFRKDQDNSVEIMRILHVGMDVENRF